MPSHRATPESRSSDQGLAPLSAWEGRLRESSGWVSALAPLDPLPPAPLTSATWERTGSLPPSLAGAQGAMFSSRPAATTTLFADREVGGRRDGEGSLVDDGPRHCTGPMDLPWSPASPSLQLHPGLPAPRTELGAQPPHPQPPRTFAPPRGRRALPDPITDPGLVLADLPLFSGGALPVPPAPAREVSTDLWSPGSAATRTSGRRRSDAAVDAVPPTGGPGSPAPAPTQTRRGRRAATSALAIDHLPAGQLPSQQGEGAFFASFGPTDLAPVIAPVIAPDATAHEMAALSAVSTALMDVPASLWDDEPLTTPFEEDDALVGETDRVFVPSRGRSAHRRPHRALRVLPQVGLVGALGLATVIAPLAGSHLPFAGTTGSSAALTHADGSLVTSPVAAAKAMIAAATPAASAPDVLSGRHRSTVSRSARRAASASSGRSSGPASSAAGSATVTSSSPVSPLSPEGASASASAAASNAAVSAAPAAPATPSPTATPTLSAEQSAIAALVPDCSGAVPSLTGAVNGQLDSSDLCNLWQPGEALRSDAAVAFAKLDFAYKAHFGTDLELSASYRPYAEQVRLKRTRPAYAAVPGTSEHGWGLAVDLGGGVQNSDEHYDWLMANAPQFGWAHPAWAQRGGGGPYEPWHWEYVAGETSDES